MNNIYDNGCILLGTKQDIERYIQKQYIENNFLDYVDDIKEILEEIKDYENDTILAINYDHSMGWCLDYWDRRDIVKEMS